MPKAKEVALDLEKLIKRLNEYPEMEISKPFICFSQYTKDSFLNMVKVLPRPLKKSVKYGDIRVEFETENISIMADISQYKIHKSIPIISELEFEKLLEE